MLAARVPDAPPKPTFSIASDSSITMALSVSPDDGGSPIIGYELEMDDGTLSTNFNPVTSYVSSSFLMTHTVDDTNDGVVTGLIY